jgi:tetratricopeptide (TPR) repeat protein
MDRIHKTVFISYSYTNFRHALAVYQNLTPFGYDCYMDYRTVDSGFWDEISLNQIKSRAHFMPILTPSALECCTIPGAPFRHEIESALDYERNIVPLMFGGFNYASPSIKKFLTGKLAELNSYPTQLIPEGFCDEAMERVHQRILSVPVDVKRHPTPLKERKVVAQKQDQIAHQPEPSMRDLGAEQFFERAFQHVDQGHFESGIADYTEAIRLNPEYAIAYNNRGIAHSKSGNLRKALLDFTEAISLEPEFAAFYNHRGLAYHNTGDYRNAILDYSEAIRLAPNYAIAYNNRGTARAYEGDTEGAIADYEAALRIDPNFSLAERNLKMAQNR